MFQNGTTKFEIIQSVEEFFGPKEQAEMKVGKKKGRKNNDQNHYPCKMNHSTILTSTLFFRERRKWGFFSHFEFLYVLFFFYPSEKKNNGRRRSNSVEKWCNCLSGHFRFARSLFRSFRPILLPSSAQIPPLLLHPAELLVKMAKGTRKRSKNYNEP